MPLKFNSTHYYRIAGKYIFSGELVIVRSAIYYFPEADLSEQRNHVYDALPHHWALIVATLLYLGQKASPLISNIEDLSREGTSDQQFREMSDVRIEKSKKARQHKNFADTLPLPTCIKAEEISDLRLSRTGRLSFSAQSDTHDFNVGLRRRKRLRDALWEMGLGRV